MINYKLSISAKIKKILFCLTLTSLNSYADISVSDTVIKFQNNENTVKNIKVQNHGENKAFVKVELYEIMNAGLENQYKILYSQNKNVKEKVQIEDPEKSGLIYSPYKLILNESNQPLSNSTIRIINSYENLDKEKVFRLRIYPVIGGFKLNETENNKSNLGLKILVGYETLIFVYPDKITHNFSYDKKNEYIQLKNKGNSNILIKDIEICSDINNCEKYETKKEIRLYSGNEYKMNVNSYIKIKFRVIYADNKTENIIISK